MACRLEGSLDWFVPDDCLFVCRNPEGTSDEEVSGVFCIVEGAADFERGLSFVNYILVSKNI